MPPELCPSHPDERPSAPVVSKSQEKAGGDKGERKAPEYPGDDPKKSPGEGWEWRGKGEPGSGKGYVVNVMKTSKKCFPGRLKMSKAKHYRMRPKSS